MNEKCTSKGGRPSLYDPQYCDQVIDFMSSGYSIAGFAGHIKVARQTVYQWAEDHPEFSDALNQARAASALWWERNALKNAVEGEGNATMLIFGLKNRVADEWRDKRELDHQSSDGSMRPQPTRIELVAPSDDGEG